MATTQLSEYSRHLLHDLSNRLSRINKFDELDKKQQSIDACCEVLSKLHTWLFQNVIQEEEDLQIVSQCIENLFKQIRLIAQSSINLIRFEDHFRKLICENEEPFSDYLSELTKREKEVFNHARKGLSYKTIGAHLCISGGTVKKHIENIYEKLNISSKYELLNLANSNASAIK